MSYSEENGQVVLRMSREDDEFEQWRQRYAPHDSGEDYDLRAAFRAGVAPDAAGHWPDLFKLPNHPTFSVDSIYAVGVNANHAGRWEGATFIPVCRLNSGNPNYTPYQVEAKK